MTNSGWDIGFSYLNKNMNYIQINKSQIKWIKTQTKWKYNRINKVFEIPVQLDEKIGSETTRG